MDEMDIDEYHIVKWFIVTLIVMEIDKLPIPHRWKDRMMVWWCAFTTKCGQSAFTAKADGNQWAAKKRHLYLVKKE